MREFVQGGEAHDSVRDSGGGLSDGGQPPVRVRQHEDPEEPSLERALEATGLREVEIRANLALNASESFGPAVVLDKRAVRECSDFVFEVGIGHEAQRQSRQILSLLASAKC